MEPTIANLRTDYIDPKAATELSAEGFPDAMQVVFIQTASETKAVVSSRLPGGAGLDLIENGYDLKGFQIKAKSCDWGPMAGFICQLPFLNKAGYEKIAYNTKELKKYLSALKKFKPYKDELLKIDIFGNDLSRTYAELSLYGEAVTAENIFLNLSRVWESWQAATTFKYINKGYIKILFEKKDIEDKFKACLLRQSSSKNPVQDAVYQIISIIRREVNKIEWFHWEKSYILREYRIKEQIVEAEWSGENRIPSNLDTPFVPLKRVIPIAGIISKLKKYKGISDVKFYNNFIGPDSKIIGKAFNNDDKNKATVSIDFMLISSDALLWSIYYRNIQYREKEGAGQPWQTYTYRQYNSADVRLNELGIKPADYSDDLVINYVNQLFNPGSPQKFEGLEYYPLCGVINPHPPYPPLQAAVPESERSTHPDFYKNAVSGDYDLFAFWPNSYTSDIKLIRQSEKYLNQNLGLSANASGLLRIDFIPGFGELTQTQQDGSKKLMESAELGNINSLGAEIAGSLNSFAAAAVKVPVNMVFHSDEGGRPGVMEIEFPVAIFFPQKIGTKALNNAGDSTLLSTRKPLSTAGGLIKNAGELMQLLLDINKDEASRLDNSKFAVKPLYKVVLHSEWLMHLFFLCTELFTQDNNTEVAAWLDSQAWYHEVIAGLPGKAKQDKIDEFVKIKKNHAKCYSKEAPFEQAEFIRNFKIVLRGQRQNGVDLEMPDGTFRLLQREFLKLAFQGSEKAISRRMRVEKLLYQSYTG